MKILSVRWPFSGLIAVRAKELETRGKAFNYRGLIGIHVCKTFEDTDRALCEYPPIKNTLARFGFHGTDNLPLGQIVAVSVAWGSFEVEAPARPCDVPRAVLPHFDGKLRQILIPPAEGTLVRAFGAYNISVGPRHAIPLLGTRKLKVPITARGNICLWDYDLDQANPPGGYEDEEYYQQ